MGIYGQDSNTLAMTKCLSAETLREVREGLAVETELL
jgi:hypothetical protein